MYIHIYILIFYKEFKVTFKLRISLSTANFRLSHQGQAVHWKMMYTNTNINIHAHTLQS